MRETYCIAGFQPCRCPLWVKLDRVGRDDTSIHVCSTPNTDRKFIASVSIAMCQRSTSHVAPSERSAEWCSLIDIKTTREEKMIARRTFIKGASMAAITATASGIHVGQSEAQQVPNSVGIEPPKLKAPVNAADCHMHTYDPARFPMPPNPRVAPTNATVEDYRLLQKRIGTTRVVIVQPRNYATDNRVTLYAISQLGPNARGVAVVTPAIADAELKAFHAGGIRGLRFSLADPSSRAVTPG